MSETSSYNKAVVSMHIATLLFGVTAILGKLISLNEFNLVWLRMFLASLVFFILPSIWRAILTLSVKLRWIFLLNGVIVAIHWLTFYGSIKIGDSASLTLLCFGSVAFFTSLVEPLMLKQKFNLRDSALGIVVFFGIALIAMANPEEQISWQSSYIRAIVVGVFSAFLATLFSVINKKYIGNNSPTAAASLQMLGGWLFLLLLLPYYITMGKEFVLIPDKMDIIYMFILAVLCTNIAFSLQMSSLKKLSAFGASLILNLEPIYGILMAVLIFHEHKMFNLYFYFGAAIILMAVFAKPLLKKFNSNTNET